MAQPQQMPNEPIYEMWFDHSGGLNRWDNPFQQPNQMFEMINANLDKTGRRQARYGVTCVGGQFTAPHGFGAFQIGTAAQQLVAIFGSYPYYSSTPGTWTLGSTAMSLPSNTYEYAMVQGATPNVGSGGPTVPWIYVYSHANWQIPPYNDHMRRYSIDLTYATSLTLCPRSLCWWQGRMWAGNIVNIDDMDEHTLAWSDIGNGDLFSLDQSIRVNPDDGDEICALLPCRASQSSLYVFKQRGVWRLDVAWGTGVLIPTTEDDIDTTSSQLVMISERVGCIAPLSISYVGAGRDADVFFLASDGVRSLRRVEQDVAGGAGEPVSAPIKDLIDRINTTYAHLSCAAVYDNKYHLAVPLDANTRNSTVLVFDLIKKRWIGQYAWSVSGWASIGRDLVWPNNAGNSLHMMSSTCWGTGVTMMYLAYRAYQSASNIDVCYTDIAYSETSRALYFEDPTRLKRWDWAEWYYIPTATNMTVSVYAAVDLSTDYKLIGNYAMPGGGTYLRTPLTAPWTNTIAGVRAVRVGLQDVPHGRFLNIKLTAQGPNRINLCGTKVAARYFEDIWTE